MDQVLYRIKDLTCSYDGSTPVLKIDELELMKGKQTVFVGKSGAGKSTILETLGLMNRTIQEGDITFYPEGGEGISLRSLWENEDELAEIRNRYYSFIFQNTNLMNNFSAFENACIPQLLQGESMEEANRKVMEAMKKVGLSAIHGEDKVTQLSGGQRQRLAFVRAITPDFEVLFGDEPTGNLDELNARELMAYIESDVHQKKRSSILVSHHIDLSLLFADQIILLVKHDEDSYGSVTGENIFVTDRTNGSSAWLDMNGKRIKDIRTLLLDKLR